MRGALGIAVLGPLLPIRPLRGRRPERTGRRITDQGAQRGEVLDVLEQLGPLGSLEVHRQRDEATVVHQEAERLQTEPSLSDVLVTVEAAADVVLGIVQVEGPETLQAQDAVERLEGRLVALGGA